MKKGSTRGGKKKSKEKDNATRTGKEQLPGNHLKHLKQN